VSKRWKLNIPGYVRHGEIVSDEVRTDLLRFCGTGKMEESNFIECNAAGEPVGQEPVKKYECGCTTYGQAGDKCPEHDTAAPAVTASSGVELIAAERKRQIEKEGWTAEHDRGHSPSDLAKAAACYAAGEPIFVEQRRAIGGSDKLPIVIFANAWPWEDCWYKPKTQLRDLVRAGALIAAAIDRLQRTNGGSDE